MGILFELVFKLLADRATSQGTQTTVQEQKVKAYCIRTYTQRNIYILVLYILKQKLQASNYSRTAIYTNIYILLSVAHKHHGCQGVFLYILHSDSRIAVALMRFWNFTLYCTLPSQFLLSRTPLRRIVPVLHWKSVTVIVSLASSFFLQRAVGFLTDSYCGEMIVLRFSLTLSSYKCTQE